MPPHRRVRQVRAPVPLQYERQGHNDDHHAGRMDEKARAHRRPLLRQRPACLATLRASPSNSLSRNQTPDPLKIRHADHGNTSDHHRDHQKRRPHRRHGNEQCGGERRPDSNPKDRSHRVVDQLVSLHQHTRERGDQAGKDRTKKPWQGQLQPNKNTDANARNHVGQCEVFHSAYAFGSEMRCQSSPPQCTI